MVKPRSSFLGGAKLHKASMHQFISGTCGSLFDLWLGVLRKVVEVNKPVWTLHSIEVKRNTSRLCGIL